MIYQLCLLSIIFIYITINDIRILWYAWKRSVIIDFFAGTTKGTGGDILILEEAAYVDPDFFYETVAPLLLVGVTSLICISTLTSDIKWVYTLSLVKIEMCLIICQN